MKTVSPKKKELCSIITAISLWTVIWKFHEISHFGNLTWNLRIQVDIQDDLFHFQSIQSVICYRYLISHACIWSSSWSRWIQWCAPFTRSRVHELSCTNRCTVWIQNMCVLRYCMNRMLFCIHQVSPWKNRSICTDDFLLLLQYIFIHAMHLYHSCDQCMHIQQWRRIQATRKLFLLICT